MTEDVVEEWLELIAAAEALEIDGGPLDAPMRDEEELKRAVMAFIIYSSRLAAQQSPWNFALEADNYTLYIYRITIDPAES